jgi:uridylate kinase
MEDQMPTKRRVLLKLSGEAFGGGSLGVNPVVVSEIAKEIAEAAKTTEIAIVVGGLSVIDDFLAAFGIYDLSDAQNGALGAVAGLVLLVVGVWFHPSVPVGE